MNIAVFGLGYVGSVSAACLADRGHNVVGVDVSDCKVDLINRGCAPVIEADIGPLVSAAIECGRLRATTDWEQAVRETDMAWVCVGTPGGSNGDINLQYLRRVSEEIGTAIKNKPNRYVIVVRSTILPGTTREVVIPSIAAHSEKISSQDFGVCYHPEFLREGSGIADFNDPPKIVIGAIDEESESALLGVYPDPHVPVFCTSIEVAEMVKYSDNAWHALKVSFANEIATVSKSRGVDGRTVMEIFCQDKKLNLSETYLRPGFAFGGSCLPKDLRALTYAARRSDLELPLLDSVLRSNEEHLKRAFRTIVEIGHRKVGIVGLSFKKGTDDLRESPLVDLAERLIGKGYDLRIFDPLVNLANVMGANREYIEKHIPHIPRLMVADIKQLLDHAQTVVIGRNDSAYQEGVTAGYARGRVIVDLVGMCDTTNGTQGYHGICW